MLVSCHQLHIHCTRSKAADLLLKAERYDVNEDGSPSKKLVDDYKSEILVKKDSGINSLKDLKCKNSITRCNFYSRIYIPSSNIKRSWY